MHDHVLYAVVGSAVRLRRWSERGKSYLGPQLFLFGDDGNGVDVLPRRDGNAHILLVRINNSYRQRWRLDEFSAAGEAGGHIIIMGLVDRADRGDRPSVGRHRPMGIRVLLSGVCYSVRWTGGIALLVMGWVNTALLGVLTVRPWLEVLKQELLHKDSRYREEC